MERVSQEWLTGRRVSLIRLPMPGRTDWYCIEAAETLDYESGLDPRRCNIKVRGLDDRLDVHVPVEWIDKHFSEQTFWPIQPVTPLTRQET